MLNLETGKHLFLFLGIKSTKRVFGSTEKHISQFYYSKSVCVDQYHYPGHECDEVSSFVDQKSPFFVASLIHNYNVKKYL